MSSLIHGILGLPGWLVLLIAGSVVFAEDALFVGSCSRGRPPRCWPAPPPNSATCPSPA
jgi:hypothetical protein